MSLVMKFGKGQGSSYICPIGLQEVEITKKDKKLTIEQFGKQLAKQLKIKDGEIIIDSINFTFSRKKE